MERVFPTPSSAPADTATLIVPGGMAVLSTCVEDGEGFAILTSGYHAIPARTCEVVSPGYAVTVLGADGSVGAPRDMLVQFTPRAGHTNVVSVAGEPCTPAVGCTPSEDVGSSTIPRETFEDFYGLDGTSTEGALYAPADTPSEAPTAPTTPPGTENALRDDTINTSAQPGTAFVLLPEGSYIHTDCVNIHGDPVEGEGIVFEVPAPQACAAFTHELSRVSVHSLEAPPTHGGPGLDAYVHATTGDFITVTATEVGSDV